MALAFPGLGPIERAITQTKNNPDKKIDRFIGYE
jgi:hypothetical protein